jgi:hypothetical protein
MLPSRDKRILPSFTKMGMSYGHLVLIDKDEVQTWFSKTSPQQQQEVWMTILHMLDTDNSAYIRTSTTTNDIYHLYVPSNDDSTSCTVSYNKNESTYQLYFYVTTPATSRIIKQCLEQIIPGITILEEYQAPTFVLTVYLNRIAGAVTVHKPLFFLSTPQDHQAAFESDMDIFANYIKAGRKIYVWKKLSVLLLVEDIFAELKAKANTLVPASPPQFTAAPSTCTNDTSSTTITTTTTTPLLCQTQRVRRSWSSEQSSSPPNSLPPSPENSQYVLLNVSTQEQQQAASSSSSTTTASLSHSRDLPPHSI